MRRRERARAGRSRDLRAGRGARGARAGQGAAGALGAHGRARRAAPARLRSRKRPRRRADGSARSEDPGAIRICRILMPEEHRFDRTLAAADHRHAERRAARHRDLQRDAGAGAASAASSIPTRFEMLEGVLRVVELQVRDIMVPRSQMTIVNRDDPPEDILPVVIESGHSRFPVIGEDRDQIVGILLAKDLLRYFAEGGRENFDIKEVPAPGRVHSREQAPQRAAQGVPRQPPSHGDRRRRVRRRVRAGDDRGRARADRRRHRR